VGEPLEVEVIRHYPIVDRVLDVYAEQLGEIRTAYRNHVYRVLNYFDFLVRGPADSRASVHVAAAFHDLGIWTAGTFDYLSPSVALARDYLLAHELQGSIPEVEAMIRFHHKLSSYAGPHAALVEPFRKADLVDVSRGNRRFGVPRDFVREVEATFAPGDFHRTLLRLTLHEFRRRPWRPLPMLRW
jgi:hypothetical protein